MIREGGVTMPTQQRDDSPQEDSDRKLNEAVLTALFSGSGIAGAFSHDALDQDARLNKSVRSQAQANAR